MTITSGSRIDGFVKDHADAEASLAAWLAVTRSSKWRHLQDVRRNYRHADAVKVASGKIVTIFNIRGNNYRLLTAINYKIGVVHVLAVLRHAEYDKEKWKETL